MGERSNDLSVIFQVIVTPQDVLVSGFGKFYLKNKCKRRGRNPATGSDLMLSARKVGTFKCSGKLRQKVNR